MKFAEEVSYNKDGSVRGEFITKSHGAIPLVYGAKMFGVDLTRKISCDKSAFRGMIFDVKYINDDGLACDANGNPLEDETTYAPLPDAKIERWDKYLYLKRDGNATLDETEWSKLSPEDQTQYRKVACMEIELSAGVPIEEPVYLCREAAIILIEMFRQDVLIGDPIIKRYQYECTHNEDFAMQFGYILNQTLKEIAARQREREMMYEAFDLLCRILDDDGDNNEGEESGDSDEKSDEESSPEANGGGEETSEFTPHSTDATPEMTGKLNQQEKPDRP